MLEVATDEDFMANRRFGNETYVERKKSFVSFIENCDSASEADLGTLSENYMKTCTRLPSSLYLTAFIKIKVLNAERLSCNALAQKKFHQFYLLQWLL